MSGPSEPAQRRTDMESFAIVAQQILAPYRAKFSSVFNEVLPTLGEDVEARKALAYAVQSGGKRFRPALVWMVAEALKSPYSVDRAALAVEFFHVSSLITDDLPCMDNDDFRRGVATTHKAFSEQIAVLASFALTAAGFELIATILAAQEREGCVLRAAYVEASQAVGLHGLIGGQQLDLAPKGCDVDSINEIIDLKTGALFKVCFVFGWLFGGAPLERLDDVRQAAIHFGRAFQIMDDIDDMDQDRKAGKQINYALLFGLENARDQVRFHIDQFCALAKALGLGESSLITLASSMRHVVE